MVVIIIVVACISPNYSVTSIDKLVCVLQCDVETATGVYSCLSVDMMFKRQVSSVKLSEAQ